MSTKTKRVTLTLHLTPGKDDLLIRWWNSIPKGQRMRYLKEAVGRYSLATFFNDLDAPEANPSALAELRSQTADILRIVANLEQRIQSGIPLNTVNVAENTNGIRLSETEITERQRNLKKATW